MKEPRTTKTHRALRAKEFGEQQLRYKASGKSVTAFCRGEGVAESTFYQGKGPRIPVYELTRVCAKVGSLLRGANDSTEIGDRKSVV